MPPIAFEQLHTSPDTYVGHTVILGGDILSTHNTEQQTFVEVLHKPLDRLEAPLTTNQSSGRFMARCNEYLDPAVYTKGREVTIAGRVLGTHTGMVGEIEYIYALISCIETHLWSRPNPAVYRSYHHHYPGYWRPYYHRRRYWHHR